MRIDKRRPRRPKNNSNAFTFSIFHDSRDIDLISRFIKIKLLRPAFVQNHISDVVRGGKVDIGLVSLIIAAGLEPRNIGNPAPVPPVPRDLTGLHPKRIADSIRFGERINDIRLDKSGRRIGQNENAPWKRPRTFRFSKIRLARFHPDPTAAAFQLLRNTGLP